ncbi:MAG: putative HTH-type transcriptional regulator, rrf2 family [Chloroflexi bacterium]|nr:putative HTH-type transcriptional regulator, rrf2 family [Chloroflexota bacterium]MDB5076126.1 putative HTH-type transcriptional regulator, rrf2 family [Chloroflexota bacterium]
MRFSARTRYGLLALMDMAEHQESGHTGRLTTHEIAARQGIPERFLEQQITALKNAGLVTSHRGAHGGCGLARRAEDITVLQVIEALEGSPLELERIGGADKENVGGAIRELWDQAHTALTTLFSEMTVASLARREQELRADKTIMFYV